MVYHVPSMLKKYGNLRQFSGQGILLSVTVIKYLFIMYILKESKKIMMTQNATTSPATSTMLLEKL